MLIIGLTGPSGSGKGHVGKYLKEKNIPSIDTDAVYHALLIPPSECLDELTNVFGREILTSDGTLDRAALARIVFSDEEKLKTLNSVTHKYILARTDELLRGYAKDGYAAAIVDAPALFESGYDKKCDFVITVTAPRELRIKRIIKRDGLSQEAATRRIDAQKSDEFYSSRSKYTVINNEDDEAVKQIDSILEAEGLAVI